MFLLNGKKICDVGFSEGEYQYPPGWIALATPAEREAVGITEVPDPVRPDDSFYLVAENEDGSYTATPRPLADARAVMFGRVQAHRDSLYEAGCEVATHGWFHNDVQSRSRWERMVNRANTEGLADGDAYLIGDTQVQWKAMDGSFVPLTAGIIRAVVAAFEVHEAAIFIAAETHKQALWHPSRADVDAIAAYDWKAGWPAVYVPAP